MPIIQNFTLPETPEAFAKVQNITTPFFITFIASKDPATNQPWCPDVRAALPVIKATFSADDAPGLAIVEVGQRNEYKSASNHYRTTWKMPNVPTLVRYERKGEKLVEVGRLVEGEILDAGRLQQFVNSLSLA
ncbi:hypothetical protein F5Y16DRAFT_372073 [Xylariaceae sp. FL0255]|nr:hypothetical protein F5Y16DRAFT_372073 [Xylariaceae sp. FL0255]